MTSPIFSLELDFLPSFRRPCTLHVSDDAVRLEVGASGLLRKCSQEFTADPVLIRELHARCVVMLQAWDMRWSRSGCDGTAINGRLDDAVLGYRDFQLWSPERNDPPFAMICAALACLPLNGGDGELQAALVHVRDAFGLQPLVSIMPGSPTRLYISPSARDMSNDEVRAILSSLTDLTPWVIDASDVYHFRSLIKLLPVLESLRGGGIDGARWMATPRVAQALSQHGVQPARIALVDRSRMTTCGHPLLMGEVPVFSPEILELAKAGNRLALVQALRSMHGLTVAQAASSAADMIELAR